MHSNTLIFAVFVLVSSAFAAPVMNRPIARRSLARRSAQGVLSQTTTAECNSDSANGPSWSEEICAQMPHVTGFRDAETGACKRPVKRGRGTGICYIKSGQPISRVYRRLVPVPEGPSKVAAPLPAVPDAPLPENPSSANTPAPGSPAPDKVISPSNSTVSTLPPDASPSTPSTSSTNDGLSPSHGEANANVANPHPGSDASALPPASASAPTSDGMPTPSDHPSATKEDGSVIASAGAQAPFSSPKQKSALPISGKEAGHTPSPSSDVPSAQAEEPVGLMDPVQAPFSPANHNSTTPAAAPDAAASKTHPQTSGSTPPSTSLTPQPIPTSSTPIPPADVPIPHGTEETWGGTIPAGALSHTKSGSRNGTETEGAKHGTLKLSRVVGHLFFDIVYGRFLF